jgi:ribose 5-phosphate isomerase B
MKVFLGSDHNGYHLKSELAEYLQRAGYEVVDVGDAKPDPEDDFPVFAHKVVTELLTEGDEVARGILLCGSGQGMCMAANRFQRIRAALGYDRESVRSARNDDNANILCLPANSLPEENLNVLAETFLNTPFADAPRFRRRLAQLDELPHA